MPNKASGSNWRSQALSAIIVALLGGSAPWWWTEVKGFFTPRSSSQIVVSQSEPSGRPITPGTATNPSQQLGATTTVQIWKVEGDRKSRLLASKEFTVPAGSENAIEPIGRWLTQEIGQRYDLTPPEVRVRVDIPSERSSGALKIQLTPPGAYELYISAVEGGQKSRIPLVDRGLANLPPSFLLEINRPGYKPANLPVPAQEAVTKNFILMPQPIKIGVDAFGSEPNTEATRITNYLVANPRFSIKDPEALKSLRQEIADGKAFFAKNPAAQVSVRTSLGVDLIIAGTIEKKSPVQ